MLTVAALLAYFLLVVAALAFAFLPAVRRRVAEAGGRCGAALRRRRPAPGAVRASSEALRRAARRGGRRVVAHARAGAAVGVVLALPPLAAWLLQDWQAIDAYDPVGSSRPPNEQVTALLRGERLVPPTPLPPDLFATPEIDAERPRLRDASRQWELLDAEFRQRLLVAFRLMQERHGYEMVLLEGYRSPARQAQLEALGPRVTGAGPGQSYHQVGLAADSAFRRDGKVVIAETDPWAMRGYLLFGDVARSVGLVWGGGWQLKDYGHVELRRAGALGRAAPAAADAARGLRSLQREDRVLGDIAVR